jgi:hypothetical protein
VRSYRAIAVVASRKHYLVGVSDVCGMLASNHYYKVCFCVFLTFGGKDYIGLL